MTAGRTETSGTATSHQAPPSVVGVGSVSMTAQWWLDVREPKKEVVAAHLVNLCWNGLTHLEPDPKLED